MADLEKRLKSVRAEIALAADRAARDPSGVTLVAVTKTFPEEVIREAYQLGIRNFGENRVEEAVGKIAILNEGLQPIPTWHMIGHLQHRKAKQAAELFDFIHSLDTVALAARLDKRVSELGKRMPVLLEVNVSGESSKYGLSPKPVDALEKTVDEIMNFKYLDVQGLMTVAPIVADPEQARPFFRSLRELRDELRIRFPDHSWPHLSMGMSDDFQIAIEEGATMVRIGRALFGERR